MCSTTPRTQFHHRFELVAVELLAIVELQKTAGDHETTGEIWKRAVEDRRTGVPVERAIVELVAEHDAVVQAGLKIELIAIGLLQRKIERRLIRALARHIRNLLGKGDRQPGIRFVVEVDHFEGQAH